MYVCIYVDIYVDTYKLSSKQRGAMLWRRERKMQMPDALVFFLGPVAPSFRALAGHLKFTVRHHKSNKDSLLSETVSYLLRLFRRTSLVLFPAPRLTNLHSGPRITILE